MEYLCLRRVRTALEFQNSVGVCGVRDRALAREPYFPRLRWIVVREVFMLLQCPAAAASETKRKGHTQLLMPILLYCYVGCLPSFFS